MNITGPPVVGNAQRPDEAGLALRLNQRVTAEVLQVSGENVTLAIQGVRVVARLTSSDQAASLTEQKVASFLIKDLTDGIVSLQIIGKGNEGQQATAVNPRDLAGSLLQEKGLELTDENLMLARALLNANQPVDAETLDQLKSALAGLGKWGEAEAHLAANMKAAGIPVSTGSLSLAMNAPKNLANELTGLLSQLQQLANQPQFSETAKSALNTLQNILLKWNQSAPDMAENLPKLVEMLGRSIEHELGDLAKGNLKDINLDALPKDLQSLLNLRNELVNRGANRTVESLDRFMESLRYLHLTNSQPETDPAGGQWARLEVPLQFASTMPGKGGQPGVVRDAGLRIAYQKDGEGRKIDPQYTRLIIQVDIDPGEVVEVDLSIVDRRIAANVTATTTPLKSAAEEELPSFAEGLTAIGYSLQSSRCTQGDIDHQDLAETKKGTPDQIKVVNLRV
jgi:hypothetical protein